MSENNSGEKLKLTVKLTEVARVKNQLGRLLRELQAMANKGIKVHVRLIDHAGKKPFVYDKAIKQHYDYGQNKEGDKKKPKHLRKLKKHEDVPDGSYLLASKYSTEKYQKMVGERLDAERKFYNESLQQQEDYNRKQQKAAAEFEKQKEAENKRINDINDNNANNNSNNNSGSNNNNNNNNNNSNNNSKNNSRADYLKKINALNDKVLKSEKLLNSSITRSSKYKDSGNNVIKAGLVKEYDAALQDSVNQAKQLKKISNELEQSKSNKTNELDPNTVKEYNEAIKQAGQYRTKLDALHTRAQRLTTDFDKSTKEAIGYNKLGAQLTGFYNKYDAQIRKHVGLNSEYLTLANKISTGDFSNFKEATRAVADFRLHARNAGVEVETFGTKLQRTFGARMRSAFAGQGVFLMYSTISDILQNTLEVDTALTELKKVTSATSSEYETFMGNASKRAVQYGATLKDTVSATADYARLGYDIPEATNLANSAIVYQNVGDNIESMEEATGSLISTMQGFGIEANDSMTIVDKFNEV